MLDNEFKWIRRESRLLKAFVKDVVQLLHLEVQIDSERRTDYANRLPPDVYSWIQNLMLRKDIQWINAGFSGLYQGKETYGFKFIRRRQQSLQSQNNPVPIDDTISAVNKIQRHLNQEQDILIDVYLEVKALLNQLKDLCKLFEDPKATEGVNYSRMACLEKMRCISLDAEDSITIYINSAKGRENHLDNTGHGSKLCMEIKRIKHTINLLNGSTKVYHIELRQKSRSSIGFEEDTHESVSRLTNNEDISVDSIVGMQGIESNDVNTLLEDVGIQVLKISELQEEPDGKDFWINKMNKFLKERKFLLVLDILTKEAWDTLKEAFPKTTNGSKILLTAHSRTVASHANQDNTPYQLRLRTKEESWRLFIQRAQVPPDNLSPSHTEALKEVVERCGGLPQAIEYLVDKFSGKDVTALDLRRVPINDHFQNGWSKTLENEDLSEDLKKCFSYFRLFPCNFEIPTRRLIALWLHKVQKKINGKVKTCRLPNALLELCLSKCLSSDRQLADHFNKNDASFAHIHGNNTTSADLQGYKRHVSFLSFDTREGTKPGEDIENFLRKAISSGCFKVLKVLDLERVFRPQLPNAIGNLIELKYLGLSHLKDGLEKWTNLRKLGLALQLPSQQQRALAKCVVKLNNLECLSLRSIDEMSKPQVLYLESLSGMENLTSLYLFGKLEIPSIISEFPQSLSDLTLSASGLKNDPMPALDKLPNLKSLCFYSGSYERREMVCSRGRFTKLLVLKLWKLEMIEELQVEEGAMQNLRELDIRSCKELKFPTGLKHLKNLRELNSWGMPEEFTTRIEEIRGKFGMSLPISYHY
uniref:NB-ARC domain-containing protein n=1 Tax=Quercus lobata TaxID=97700 RepID=A0A7N2LML6_QUELO